MDNKSGHSGSSARAFDGPPTLVALLRARAAECSGRPAYTFLSDDGEAETSLTYAALDREARAIGALLQSQGAQGERVLLLYPPGLDYIAAFFGCLYAGAVAVPVYPPKANQTLPRLKAIIEDSGATVALTTSQTLSRVSPPRADSPGSRTIRWLTADDVGADLAGEWRDPGVSPRTLAFLQYTSGSTAEPKGVMVSHGNLMHNERMIQRAFGQTAESVVVGWLPLYHDMGLIGNVLQPLYIGGRCVLMSPASFLQRPLRWLQAISDYRATTSGGPDFAYDLCARKVAPEERERLDLSSWSVAYNGSEPIRHDTLDRFVAAFEPSGFRREAFFPCYGLAEATLFVSGPGKERAPTVATLDRQALVDNRVVALSPEREGAAKLVGCGRAWGDEEILVIDPQTLTRCPPDVIGEVWVAGANVAEGYWNQPEESERTFRARLADTGEGPYLRTGDLGLVKGGELFLTGRLKDLIIIRGRNYYPQDIELTAERSHDGLRPGCGAAFSADIDGVERLVVVQEVKRGYRNQDAEQLIRAIRQAVAREHDVQPFAVALVGQGSIPKTSSGKIRRHLCRARFLDGRLDTVREWRETATPEEEVWAEMPAAGDVEAIEGWLASRLAARLGMRPSEIDVRQPIASYGVDSLTATELMHDLETAFGVCLPVAECLQSPSLAHLASQAHAQAAAGAAAGAAPAPARHDDSTREQALTYGQRALWFLHQVAPESSAYNMAGAARVRDGLDVPVLERVLQALVDRHPSLRTSFAASSGEPVQRVNEGVGVRVRVEDASGWDESLLSRRLSEEADRPFDLGEAPLLRVTLFKRAGGEHIVLLVVHHLIADFWSLALLVKELAQLYEAEKTGAKPALDTFALSYTDYARRQAETLAGPEGERLFDFWREQLAGAPPVLNLPTDRTRPPVQTFQGASHTFDLGAGLTEKLKALARAQECTLYTVLVAAFQVLLHRYTGQDDLLVGSPASGRGRAELAPLVGYFVNPVVIRARFTQDSTFEEFLGRARQTVLEALEHQDYPFALLVERLQPERDTSRSPLYQVLFTLQQSPLPDAAGLASFALGVAGAGVNVGGLLLEPMALEQRVAQFDLTLMMADLAGGLTASLQYNESLFDAPTAARLAGHFRILLEEVAAYPQRKVSDLQLLTVGERHQLLMEWNDTDGDYPRDACLHHLFEAQVKRSPDAVALVFENQQVTYRELNRRANQLARRLNKLGVGPDVRVGICLERSPEMMVALLGVLKTGGAYVPLDPAYPQERLAFVLEDARTPVLLTQEALAGSLPASGARQVRLDAGWGEIAGEDAHDPVGTVSADHLAYVIYTSGSTGRPKGVMVSHRNVVNFCAAMDASVGGRAGTWLAVTSISFDISVLELFWTLTRGFRVVLQPTEGEAADAAGGRPRAAGGKMDFSLFFFANEEAETAGDKYELLFESAKFADRHDFLAVWTPERHFHAFGGLYPNPSVAGAALAAITQRIHIRAGSVVLPLHNPIRVAEEWAFVDNISKGRVGVSFASGWHADDFVFAPENYAGRKEVMMRQLETVRRLWRGESVRFKGGAGNNVEVKIRPRPVQPELPIWVTAAGSPETFRAAGAAGTNLLTHLLGQSVEQLAEKIEVYRKAWRARSGAVGRGRVTLMLHTFVEGSPEVVREKVRKPFCSYLASSLDLAKGLLRTLDQELEEGLSADDVEALLSLAFDRYYETSGLFGTPESCLPMIDRLREIGVDELACLIDFGVDTASALSALNHLDALRRLGNAGSKAGGEAHSPAEQIVRHRVTHLQCTPSFARMLTADPEAARALGSLDKLLLGGEALPTSLAAQLEEVAPGKVHNMYGPTETTVWSLTHHGCRGDNTVLIGRPVANTQVYITDGQLNPVAVGVPGEVYIGGEGVARGYLNRPALTAERFIPDAFGKRPGGRLYRTGDCARYLPDGNVEFMGRSDHQVKIRGHRVELAEIESSLRQHPAVREAVVVAREDAPGDVRLIAYLVPRQASAPAAADGFAPPDGDRAGAGRPRYRLPNGMVIAHHGSFQTSVIFKEVFEDEVYFRHGISLEEGDCVFDVGANIGLFTLYVHRNFKNVRVYAFEPIPPNFDVLRANVALHGVGAKLFACGLSNAAGAAQFTFYPRAAGLSGRSSSVEEDRRETESIVRGWLRNVASGEAVLPREELGALLEEYLEAETYTCQLRTISDVIREQNVERIDLLKIDVEKSEFDVLAGIENDDWEKIRQVVVEVHSRELLSRVVALLEWQGFTLTVDESFVVKEDSAGGEVYVAMLYATRGPAGVPRAGSEGAGDQAGPVAPQLTAEGVRDFLREKLPAYMIPSAFVTLDALPLTPNGKVDRRALPAPDPRRAGTGRDIVEPRTPTEKMLADIWADILGVERVGVDDNFFDLGGHSLMATQLVTRIRAGFTVELTLRDFLKYPTIAGLAELVEESILARSSDAKIDEMLSMLSGLDEEEAQRMLGLDDGPPASR